jgi:hypothetical protein
MASLFGGGKTPKAEPYVPPPDPEIAKKAIAEATERERAAQRAKSGRAASMSNEGIGDPLVAETAKTILGG